jgi:aldehyde dehydrogenase (NAD+)
LEYRRKQLLQVARLVQENADALKTSLKADLGRYPFEAALPELGPMVSSALHAAENLETWTSPEKPQVEAWRSVWDTTIFKAPKGTVVNIRQVVTTCLCCLGAILTTHL